MKEANVTGRRADHVKDVGRITRQMYDDILSSDFCIALLYNFNPNVFYELAVAHSAGIPVILLSEKGVDPPFDIKDERVLHYDLSPRAIHGRHNVSALLEMIDSVRRLGGKRQVPFGDNLIPLNAQDQTNYSVRGETNASAEEWRKIVRSARKRLYLAGIGFSGWKGIPGMKEELQETAISGCDVRILTIDGQNPACASLFNPNVASHDATTRGQAFEEVRVWFRSAVGKGAQCEVRSLRNGMLFQQIVIHDDTAMVSPYLHSANTGFSPCVTMTVNCPAFGTFLREFEELWKANEPVLKS